MAEIPPIELTVLEIDAAWQAWIDSQPPEVAAELVGAPILGIIELAYKHGFTDGAISALKEARKS